MTSSFLEVESLTKRFGGLTAVNKTTLLRTFQNTRAFRHLPITLSRFPAVQ